MRKSGAMTYCQMAFVDGGDGNSKHYAEKKMIKRVKDMLNVKIRTREIFQQ